MTTLLVFLPPDAAPYTLERLEAEISPLFRGDDELRITMPIRPFIGDKHLHFGWGERWGFSAYLENDRVVTDDARHIQGKLGNVFPKGLPSSRIRLGFGQDSSKDFTNHIIWVWEHFAALPSVTIYDVTREELW